MENLIDITKSYAVEENVRDINPENNTLPQQNSVSEQSLGSTHLMWRTEHNTGHGAQQQQRLVTVLRHHRRSRELLLG